MTEQALLFVPLAAAVIGVVVRLLKQDVHFLPTVPARWRPWIAMALGLVSSALLHLEPGKSWFAAIVEGLTAGVLAIAGHELGIESLKNGKEIAGGGSGEKPPTPPMLPVLLVLVACLSSCAAMASSSYEKQMTDCAEKSPTLEASHACREDVRKRWHVVDGSVQP
jgi:hypothetical protein